jgi:2-hydroxychromene-2-carboxylate isomerase
MNLQATDSPTVDWYFDFISPFAYLQWRRLRQEAPALTLRPVPVLFAGLLAHWDNKGPVEIPPKRGWTYAHCLWIARRHQIPMRLPAGHPFNSLPLLRLSIALGNAADVIDRLFDFVWRDGHLPGAGTEWQQLLESMGNPALDADNIKAELRGNGDKAITAGVFGVPTAVIGGDIFWGVDATDMLLARAAGDPFFTSAEYNAAFDLPVSAARR